MNFTFVRKGDIIILCTRKNTKKFAQIKQNHRVAVLIHDFPHLNNENAEVSTDLTHGKSWSITLNGICEALEIGSFECEKV